MDFRFTAFQEVGECRPLSEAKIRVWLWGVL